MNTFGVRLRQARSARGLSQDELAARMDVSKSAISAWENDRESPAFDKLARLRSVLEASLDELICGDQAAKRMAQQAQAIAEGRDRYGAFNEAVSREELRLLRMYRALATKRQRGLLALLSE